VRAYFIREALEVCLVVAALAIADWITRVAWWLWIALPVAKALASIVFYVVFLRQDLMRHPRHELTCLVGKTVFTLAPLNPDGQIKIGGEIWSARSLHSEWIPAQRDVIIRDVRGNVLLVEANASERGADASSDQKETHRDANEV